MRSFFTVIFVIIFSFFGLIAALIFKLLTFGRKKSPNKGFGGFGGFSNSNKTAGGSNFGGNPQSNNDTNKDHEGEIKITTTGGEDRKLKDKVGEYVDFDEIK